MSRQNKVESIEKIEQQRLKTRRMDLILLVLCFLFWGLFAKGLFFTDINKSAPILALLFTAMGLTAIAVAVMQMHKKKYLESYKQKILCPIIERNFPDFSYSPRQEEFIRNYDDSDYNGKTSHAELYKAFDIYWAMIYRDTPLKRGYYIYRGDHFIRSSQSSFLEVDLIEAQGMNTNPSIYSSKFKGLFFTSVLSGACGRPITIESQTGVSSHDVHRTGNPEFDRLFLVKTESQYISTILNQQTLVKILELAKEIDYYSLDMDYHLDLSEAIPSQSPLSIKIIESKIYLGIRGIEIFRIKYHKKPVTAQTRSIKLLKSILELMQTLEKNIQSAVYGSE